MKRILVLFATMLITVATLAPVASARHTEQQVELTVTIENLAPENGTFQTPFWVALHDGTFDIYDRNQPASNEPQPGSVALERLAEDGNTGPITEEFASLSEGMDATVPGPNGPIGPGETASTTFTVDPMSPEVRFFSYASMVLPSNDFFVANGDPQAHQVFDDNGRLVVDAFVVGGDEVLDAGTEINDEVPANTAFFGQQAPDTGGDENGVVTGQAEGLTGFAPASEGGILADPQFSNADFTEPGYQMVRISFEVTPIVTDNRVYLTRLSGANEVPPVDTPASGRGVYRLREDGTVLRFLHVFRGLENVVGAHLHLGAPGENGPVVVSLLNPPADDPFRRLRGEVTASDLTGPLAGRSLSALVAEIEAGNIYVNVHTNDGQDPAGTGPGDFPSGEIRGQLGRPGTR